MRRKISWTGYTGYTGRSRIREMDQMTSCIVIFLSLFSSSYNGRKRRHVKIRNFPIDEDDLKILLMASYSEDAVPMLSSVWIKLQFFSPCFYPIVHYEPPQKGEQARNESVGPGADDSENQGVLTLEKAASGTRQKRGARAVKAAPDPHTHLICC